MHSCKPEDPCILACTCGLAEARFNAALQACSSSRKMRKAAVPQEAQQKCCGCRCACKAFGVLSAETLARSELKRDWQQRECPHRDEYPTSDLSRRVSANSAVPQQSPQISSLRWATFWRSNRETFNKGRGLERWVSSRSPTPPRAA